MFYFINRWFNWSLRKSYAWGKFLEAIKSVLSPFYSKGRYNPGSDEPVYGVNVKGVVQNKDAQGLFVDNIELSMKGCPKYRHIYPGEHEESGLNTYLVGPFDIGDVVFICPAGYQFYDSNNQPVQKIQYESGLQFKIECLLVDSVRSLIEDCILEVDEFYPDAYHLPSSELFEWNDGFDTGVTVSAYGRDINSSSPFLLKKVANKYGIDFQLRYYFGDLKHEGYYEVVVPNAVTVYPTRLVESKITLTPYYDFLVEPGSTLAFQIVAVEGKFGKIETEPSINFTYVSDTGKSYNVRKTHLLSPVYNDYLRSEFSIELTSSEGESDFLNQLVDRVKPVRSYQLYVAAVSARIPGDGLYFPAIADDSVTVPFRELSPFSSAEFGWCKIENGILTRIFAVVIDHAYKDSQDVVHNGASTYLFLNLEPGEVLSALNQSSDTITVIQSGSQGVVDVEIYANTYLNPQTLPYTPVTIYGTVDRGSGGVSDYYLWVFWKDKVSLPVSSIEYVNEGNVCLVNTADYRFTYTKYGDSVYDSTDSGKLIFNTNPTYKVDQSLGSDTKYRVQRFFKEIPIYQEYYTIPYTMDQVPYYSNLDIVLYSDGIANGNVTWIFEDTPVINYSPTNPPSYTELRNQIPEKHTYNLSANYNLGGIIVKPVGGPLILSPNIVVIGDDAFGDSYLSGLKFTNESISPYPLNIGKRAFEGSKYFLFLEANLHNVDDEAFDGCISLGGHTDGSFLEISGFVGTFAFRFTNIQNVTFKNGINLQIEDLDEVVYTPSVNSTVTEYTPIPVTDTNVSVTGVTVDPSIIEGFVSYTYKVTATVKPNNASNKNVTWSSSDSTIATVSQSGDVIILTEGAVDIIATTVDGEFTSACSITAQYLPKGGQFYGSSITNLTIDAGVVPVGGVFNFPSQSFENTLNLGNVIIPFNSLVHIYERAFKGSSIRTFQQSQGTTILEEEAFRDTDLNSSDGFVINELDNNGVIPYYCYGDSKISKWLYISGTDTVKVIDDYAFYNCINLTYADRRQASPDSQVIGSLERVGKYAFYNCTSLAWTGQGWRSSGCIIDDYAFYNSGIAGTAGTPLTITNLTLGKYAFAKCPEIIAVANQAEVDSGAGSLSEGLFSDCTHLTTYASKFATIIPDSCFKNTSLVLSSTLVEHIIDIKDHGFHLVETPINVGDTIQFKSIETIGAYGCNFNSVNDLNIILGSYPAASTTPSPYNVYINYAIPPVVTGLETNKIKSIGACAFKAPSVSSGDLLRIYFTGVCTEDNYPIIDSNFIEGNPVISQYGFNFELVNRTDVSVTGGWNFVVYAFNQYICVSNTITLAVSPDGYSWATQNLLSGVANLKAGAYDPGQGVLVLLGTQDQAIATYSTTLDNTQWIYSTISQGDRRCICFGAGKFVSPVYGSHILSWSTNGQSWTDIELPVTGNWISVAYGGDKFIILNENSQGTHLYSTDGIRWVSFNIVTSDTFNFTDIAYGNGKFVATGYPYVFYSASLNPPTFTAVSITSLVTGVLSSISYGEGVFLVMAANKGSIMSEDGINWYDTLGHVAFYDLFDVVYGQTFVAIPKNNQLRYYIATIQNTESYPLNVEIIPPYPWYTYNSDSTEAADVKFTFFKNNVIPKNWSHYVVGYTGKMDNKYTDLSSTKFKPSPYTNIKNFGDIFSYNHYRYYKESSSSSYIANSLVLLGVYINPDPSISTQETRMNASLDYSGNPTVPNLESCDIGFNTNQIAATDGNVVRFIRLRQTWTNPVTNITFTRYTEHQVIWPTLYEFYAQPVDQQFHPTYVEPLSSWSLNIISKVNGVDNIEIVSQSQDPVFSNEAEKSNYRLSYNTVTDTSGTRGVWTLDQVSVHAGFTDITGYFVQDQEVVGDTDIVTPRFIVFSGDSSFRNGNQPCNPSQTIIIYVNPTQAYNVANLQIDSYYPYNNPPDPNYPNQYVDWTIISSTAPSYYDWGKSSDGTHLVVNQKANTNPPDDTQFTITIRQDGYPGLPADDPTFIITFSAEGVEYDFTVTEGVITSISDPTAFTGSTRVDITDTRPVVNSTRTTGGTTSNHDWIISTQIVEDHYTGAFDVIVDPSYSNQLILRQLRLIDAPPEKLTSILTQTDTLTQISVIWVNNTLPTERFSFNSATVFNGTPSWTGSSSDVNYFLVFRPALEYASTAQVGQLINSSSHYESAVVNIVHNVNENNAAFSIDTNPFTSSDPFDIVLAGNTASTGISDATMTIRTKASKYEGTSIGPYRVVLKMMGNTGAKYLKFDIWIQHNYNFIGGFSTSAVTSSLIVSPISTNGGGGLNYSLNSTNATSFHSEVSVTLGAFDKADSGDIGRIYKRIITVTSKSGRDGSASAAPAGLRNTIWRIVKSSITKDGVAGDYSTRFKVGYYHKTSTSYTFMGTEDLYLATADPTGSYTDSDGLTNLAIALSPSIYTDQYTSHVYIFSFIVEIYGGLTSAASFDNWPFVGPQDRMSSADTQYRKYIKYNITTPALRDPQFSGSLSTFPAQGTESNTQQLQVVDTDHKGWYANADDYSWLWLTGQYSGSGDLTINVFCSPNTGDVRTATLKLTNPTPRDVIYDTITVTQAAYVAPGGTLSIDVDYGSSTSGQVIKLVPSWESYYYTLTTGGNKRWDDIDNSEPRTVSILFYTTPPYNMQIEVSYNSASSISPPPYFTPSSGISQGTVVVTLPSGSTGHLYLYVLVNDVT